MRISKLTVNANCFMLTFNILVNLVVINLIFVIDVSISGEY